MTAVEISPNAQAYIERELALRKEGGRRLRSLRVAAGLTQFSAAVKLNTLLTNGGTTDRAIRRWEAGGSRPRSKTLRAYMNLLDVRQEERDYFFVIFCARYSISPQAFQRMVLFYVDWREKLTLAEREAVSRQHVEVALQGEPIWAARACHPSIEGGPSLGRP